RLSTHIGNDMLTVLTTNGTNNHRLCFCPFNNESANHYVFTLLNKATTTLFPYTTLFRSRKTVRFDESNSGGVVLTAYNGGVISRMGRCNNCRPACLTPRQSACFGNAYLVAADNAADLPSLPVFVNGNQRRGAGVQLQPRG